MITKQKAERLRKKILESRLRLMEDKPFFAILLMYLKFVAVPEMKKVSTDGTAIYFAPEYLDKLHQWEVDFVLCHQIMHIVCGDIFTPPDILCDSYHLSCDIRINCLLDKMNIGVDSYSHLGHIYKRIPGTQNCYEDPAEMTPEEIFRELPLNIDAFDEQTKNKFLFDSDSFWNNEKGNPDGAITLIDFYAEDSLLSFAEESDAEGAGSGGGLLLKQKWRSRAAFAAKQAANNGKKGNGHGNFSELMERFIQNRSGSSLDWKKILNDFVQEEICDYSFSPPDRRFFDTGFFLPDFNEKDFFTKDVLFWADTSGSVDEEELSIVYAEICSALEQFDGKIRGKLGFFDTEVVEAIEFDNASELLKIVPFGGGGTDFRPIFEYISENQEKLPACVVIFTDGEGDYPDESAALGIPVLWIINNDYVTPPFGKIARLNMEKYS